MRCWEAGTALGVHSIRPSVSFGETEARLGSFPLGSVQDEAVSGEASPSSGAQRAPARLTQMGSPPSAGPRGAPD